MSTPLSPRLFRVHGSNYWADEVMLAPATHTDERLAEVAKLGYDAVWIHAELRQLHPTELFEPWEPDSEARLAALVTTVQRAARHGIAVWLYVCEPRSYDVEHPFWQAHPECRGHLFKGGTHLGWRWPGVRAPLYGMCLGAEPVRKFLSVSTEAIFKAAPQLGGILVTTASEHHGHCYARFAPGRETMTCPRCAEADPTQMPAIVARQMLDGIERAGVEPTGKLCFWSWSWHRHLEPAPCPRTLEALPPQVTFMSIFEMGGDTVERLGRPIEVDEYLFCYPGPSRNFQEQAALCRRQGRPLWAKLQISATHEIASVPNIPLPGVLYDKIARCRDQGVSGIMSIWTMGARPTLNSHAAARLMQHTGPLLPRDAWLRDLAADYFEHRLNDNQIEQVLAAWDGFFTAMQHHPATISFLYMGPVNYALSYPWKLQRDGTRMARNWTDEPWGDNLEHSLGDIYSLEEAATLLDALASAWQFAAAGYIAALSPHEGRCHRTFEERSVAEAIGLFFRSAADVYRFAERVDAGAPGNVLLALIEREEATCRRMRELVSADPRLGRHDDVEEPMVSPVRIDAKLQNLQTLRQQIAHARLL